MKDHKWKDTRLAAFLRERIEELAPRKSQVEIARAIGYDPPNMLSMIKAGQSRLPLDKVEPLARELEVDPARLLELALEQHGVLATVLRIMCKELAGGAPPAGTGGGE